MRRKMAIPIGFLAAVRVYISQRILKVKYHSIVDLLFDWFGISFMTTDNFCFYLQNRLIQTSQTGGQWYSDTSLFSIPFTSHCVQRLPGANVMKLSTVAIYVFCNQLVFVPVKYFHPSLMFEGKAVTWVGSGLSGKHYRCSWKGMSRTNTQAHNENS
jgi:hypothetical protein